MYGDSQQWGGQGVTGFQDVVNSPSHKYKPQGSELHARAPKCPSPDSLEPQTFPSDLPLWVLCPGPCPDLPESLDFPSTVKCPGLEVRGPKNEVPFGVALNLSCSGCSLNREFSEMYWLGNGSFIEDLPGAVSEGDTRKVELSESRVLLLGELRIEALSPALRHTNFSCILLDPEGAAQSHVILDRLWDLAAGDTKGGGLTRGPGARTLKLMEALYTAGSGYAG
ncbi:interleukin-18-binding protein [Tachyglossus aculeatus]|uniref:interleukin-18-binding protein n=1 Tax=Tachyglossus aculeatus TaxID=9261 RepID=UPI0018F4B9BC|nr:interleukin-18-binding protein [Tachyglossus aculeatus]